MKQFDITYFYGPPSEYIVKEECVADIAASGMTLCQLFQNTAEANKQALPLLKKYGMKANIFETRVTELIRSKDISAVDAIVKEVVEDYSGFDNIAGWDISDEPDSEMFPMLSAVTSAFHKYSPNQEVVINLYPNYATPEMYKDTDYLAHLNRFVEIVEPDFLSYDHYHFMGRKKKKRSTASAAEEEKERLIRLAAEQLEDRDDFFENLEDVRRIGLKHNLEQMLIILLTEHGCCRNLTRAEILWEVNMCLVYGMHRISYFTYWLPGSDDDEDNEDTRYWSWDNAMCDRHGNKYEHYYDVQAINKEIYPIGNRLFKTKSKEVYHIGKTEKGTRAFQPYGHITDIEGENVVVGFFEDGCVYLVNRDFKQENTIVLYADEPFEIYHAGGFEPSEKIRKISLSAGAGVLMRWNASRMDYEGE